MIFSEEYCSRIEDFGRGGLMTPEAVLRIFENTGSHHSDSVGDSLISGTAAGVAWIVAEWNIQIHRTPAYGEKLIQSTYAVGLKPSIQCKRRISSTSIGGKQKKSRKYNREIKVNVVKYIPANHSWE